jgi:hypothetical protein
MCIVLLLLFFGQFFLLFFLFRVSFRSEFFQPKNRNRTRFPPAAPGRSSEASDTSHTSLSVTVWVSRSRRFVSELLDLRPAGRPYYIKHIKHIHTYIYIIHRQTHSYKIYVRRHCFVNDDVRNSRATVYCSAGRRWPDRDHGLRFPQTTSGMYKHYMHIILPNREYLFIKNVLFFFIYLL